MSDLNQVIRDKFGKVLQIGDRIGCLHEGQPVDQARRGLILQGVEMVDGVLKYVTEQGRWPIAIKDHSPDMQEWVNTHVVDQSSPASAFRPDDQVASDSAYSEARETLMSVVVASIYESAEALSGRLIDARFKRERFTADLAHATKREARLVKQLGELATWLDEHAPRADGSWIDYFQVARPDSCES